MDIILTGPLNWISYYERFNSKVLININELVSGDIAETFVPEEQVMYESYLDWIKGIVPFKKILFTPRHTKAVSSIGLRDALNLVQPEYIIFNPTDYIISKRVLEERRQQTSDLDRIPKILINLEYGSFVSTEAFHKIMRDFNSLHKSELYGLVLYKDLEVHRIGFREALLSILKTVYKEKYDFKVYLSGIWNGMEEIEYALEVYPDLEGVITSFPLRLGLAGRKLNEIHPEPKRLSIFEKDKLPNWTELIVTDFVQGIKKMEEMAKLRAGLSA